MTPREVERHRPRKATHRNTDEPDTHVPDSKVRQELGGLSRMCLWRWDHDRKMIDRGWPPAIELNGRKYRSRRLLERFKQALMRRAIERRDTKTGISEKRP